MPRITAHSCLHPAHPETRDGPGAAQALSPRKHRRGSLEEQPRSAIGSGLTQLTDTGRFVRYGFKKQAVRTVIQDDSIFQKILLICRYRERRGERGRETPVGGLSCAPQTRDRPCTPGLCPAVWAARTLSHSSQGPDSRLY